MKKKYLLIFFFNTIIFTSYTYCQTYVKGTVLDIYNNPIADANVSFVAEKTETKTDSAGKFILKSNQTLNKISVSFIGYQKKIISLKRDTTLNLLVLLTQNTTSLAEIMVLSGKKKRTNKKQNPAYKILENVWKNKKRNGLNLVKCYEYKKYSSTEFGFDNLDTVYLKKALGKNFDSVANKINTNKQNHKFFVPVELLEKNEKIYGNNIFHKERIDTEGERDLGIKQEGKILDKIANTFKEIDIYKNDIEILGKTFVSPIANEGFGTYDYTLTDSTIIDNKKYYTIDFYPRQTRDFAFYGSFTVANTNFAVVEIEMRTPKKMNLNFVKNFEFKKWFTVTQDSIYLPSRNQYHGYFSLLTKNEDEKGIYVIKNEVFNDYLFDKTHKPNFYDSVIVHTCAHQFDKDPQYWLKLEDKETITTNTVINTIQKSSKIKNISGFIYTISDGYVNLGNGLQWGNIWSTAARNDVEGLRLRFGLRTFKTNNDRLRLETYAAYGLLDKKAKFGFEARYLLANNPRIILSAAYLKDNEQMGLTQFNGISLIPDASRSPKALFNRGRNYLISLSEKKMLRFDFEPIKNLHLGITASHNVMESAAPFRFSQAHFDKKLRKVQSTLTDFTTDIYLTYTPTREISGFGVDQKIGYTLYPTLRINFKKGFRNVLGSNFNYNRIQAQYNKPIILGKFGILDATLGTGKTFEPLPLALLTAVSSNQTYFLLPNTFALLDYYDFVADTYFEGHFEHHLNGFLLNRIPIIKKLNLRSLLTFRGVYGTISDGSKEINRSSIIYVAPTKPYFEYGFGFENIGYGNIRPLRIDFITRSDFTNFNGPKNPKYGLRLSIRANF